MSKNHMDFEFNWKELGNINLKISNEIPEGIQVIASSRAENWEWKHDIKREQNKKNKAKDETITVT